MSMSNGRIHKSNILGNGESLKYPFQDSFHIKEIKFLLVPQLQLPFSCCRPRDFCYFLRKPACGERRRTISFWWIRQAHHREIHLANFKYPCLEPDDLD